MAAWVVYFVAIRRGLESFLLREAPKLILYCICTTLAARLFCNCNICTHRETNEYVNYELIEAMCRIGRDIRRTLFRQHTSVMEKVLLFAFRFEPTQVY